MIWRNRIFFRKWEQVKYRISEVCHRKVTRDLCGFVQPGPASPKGEIARFFSYDVQDIIFYSMDRPASERHAVI